MSQEKTNEIKQTQISLDNRNLSIDIHPATSLIYSLEITGNPGGDFDHLVSGVRLFHQPDRRAADCRGRTGVLGLPADVPGRVGDVFHIQEGPSGRAGNRLRNPRQGRCHQVRAHRCAADLACPIPATTVG